MPVSRLIVKNYRCLEAADVAFAAGTNIIVGDNDTGKSTLLEALYLGLTGAVRGRSIRYQLHPLLFNTKATTAYIEAIAAGKAAPSPEILIEVFLEDEDDVAFLLGDNNSLGESAPGVQLRIRLDPAFAEEYREYLGREGEVLDVPVEYYEVQWLSFANDIMTTRKMPLRPQLIDAGNYSLDRQTNRYLLEVVGAHLSPAERVNLALAYRKMRRGFESEPGVMQVNEILNSRYSDFTEKDLSIGHDSVNDTTWEEGVVPHLDSIPMSLVGRGEQASTKIWLAMHAASSCGVFLVEEPENHLSYTSLHQMIDRLSDKAGEKQLFLTTHSSYVVNKLGIQEVILFNRGRHARLSDLSDGTEDYFRKLPGHDTLRLILSKRAILVEGPSDELVVQRAFQDVHGCTPLEDGVDVISVRSLAFKRFLEIAELVGAQVAVVTDNDGDVAALKRKYDGWFGKECIDICYPMDEELPTLEPQLVAANGLDAMNEILGKDFGDSEALIEWMSKNKTEAALRVMESEHDVSFPAYIIEAVGE